MHILTKRSSLIPLQFSDDDFVNMVSIFNNLQTNFINSILNSTNLSVFLKPHILIWDKCLQNFYFFYNYDK